MPNAVMFITFSLAKGASAEDFFLASEKVHSEFMSKQKGYISWKRLLDGETWADLLTWETMSDAKNAFEASGASAVNHEFFSFIDEASVKVQLFTVEKSY